MLDTKEGKETFSKVAEAYDRVRPGYPDAVLCEFLARAKLSESSNVLEIGCGTGQFTRKMGRAGFKIQAIDIGAALIERAKDNCREFENIDFSCIPFEDLSIQNHYDAIVSATAFHWLDTEIRFVKSANLLNRGGTLSIIQNISKHQEQEPRLRQALNDVYERCIPKNSERRYQSLENKSGDLLAEFENCPLFGPVDVYSHRFVHTLDAADYVALLDTFSYQHNLPPQVKSELFEGIKNAINEYGGTIDLHYESRLAIADKR